MTWSDTRLVSQNLSSFRIEVADDFPRLDEAADSSDRAETMIRIFRLHFFFSSLKVILGSQGYHSSL